MLVSKQLSIICFFQSHTNGGLLIGELADTTVINNMQRSDVHKVADCRHTQQSPAQLIRVSLPRSPVKMPNCQSQHKKLQVWKLLGNGLKKAFSFLWYIWKEVRKLFNSIRFRFSNGGRTKRQCFISHLRYIHRMLAETSTENKPSYHFRQIPLNEDASYQLSICWDQ